MDSTEKNESQPIQWDADSTKKDATSENNGTNGKRPGGKRMRIKDTRKVDYNHTTPAGSPYNPVYGQTRQSSYQQRQYSSYEKNEAQAPFHRPRAEYGYNNQEDNGGYQRRSYNNQGEDKQDGYQPRRTYNYQSGGQGGYQRRSYNNQGEGRQDGYQQRRTYNNQGGGQGGFQRRSYNNQGEGRQDGYQQRRTYNNQGGGQGGFQRKNYNNQGGYQQRKPMQNKRTTQKVQFVKPVKYQEVITDPTAPIRLNKFLANAGVCSRREADEFIQAGVIKVNDKVITELGTKITRQDKVMFHDQPVQIESKVYILLNKPKNCVTTSDDPQNRITVMDLVKTACQERIYPVGRLDRNTTGVLLLTNDGEMAAKLTHPSYKKKKIYHVWLDREVTVEDMEKLANGIELEDGEIHADAVSYANDNDKTQVGIEIHSGKNRVVRRMFETLGYHVVKLDRVYFAGLTKKNLSRGKWRYLSEQEVNALRMGTYE